VRRETESILYNSLYLNFIKVLGEIFLIKIPTNVINVIKNNTYLVDKNIIFGKITLEFII